MFAVLQDRAHADDRHSSDASIDTHTHTQTHSLANSGGVSNGAFRRNVRFGGGHQWIWRPMLPAHQLVTKLPTLYGIVQCTQYGT